VLSVANLVSHYGLVQALGGVSLDVKEGEIVTLIGANGAGKTTLLKSIMNVVTPTTGEIRLRNESLFRLPTESIVKRGVVLVQEGRGILRRMTAQENLLMGGYVRQNSEEVDRAMETVYTMFPVLRSRRKQMAGTLSGGEQQMLAIGRALMSWPQLILFDEISLGLSPLVIKQIYQRVKQINTEGITALLVEQDIQRSLKAAHNVYVMQSGRIRLEGEPKSLTQEDIRKAYFGLSDLNRKSEAEKV